jgi:hypothetical protein
MRNILVKAAASACLVFSIAACSDSTGPLVEPGVALKSLALGMGSFGADGSFDASTINGSMDVLEPLLTRVNVTINGASRAMYGLGVRQTVPAGTCLENVLIYPDFPPEPGVCTPFQLGADLILWESHSANSPPDRIIIIGTDEGTTDFSFASTEPIPSVSLVGFALYLEGTDKVWFSSGGSLNTHITSTGQGCSIPLPPYAKSGACTLATFDEEGAISVELLSDNATNISIGTIRIPRQTLQGIWVQITETQPFTVPVSAATRGLSRQSARAPLLSVLGKFRTQVRR